MAPRKAAEEAQKRQKREEIEACLRWIEHQPVVERFQPLLSPCTGTGTGAGAGSLPSLTTQTPPLSTFCTGTQYVPHGLASSNDESGSSAGHSEGSPAASASAPAAAPPPLQNRIKRLKTHVDQPPAAPASSAAAAAAAPDAPLLTEQEARLQMSRLFVLPFATYRSHRSFEAGSLGMGSAAASAPSFTEPPPAPALPAPALPAPAHTAPAPAPFPPSSTAPSYPVVVAALLREHDSAAQSERRPVLALRAEAFFRHMQVGRVAGILGVSEAVAAACGSQQELGKR